MTFVSPIHARRLARALALAIAALALPLAPASAVPIALAPALSATRPSAVAPSRASRKTGKKKSARVARTPAASARVKRPALSITPATETQRARRSRRRHRRAAPAVDEAPSRYTAPRTAAALTSDLGTMIEAHTRGGRWGAIVVSLTRGDTLFRLNADEPMQPASTMKMFTSAIALERFGPDYQFSTDVLRDGAVGPDGVVQGNLILRGDGDPALSNRFLRGDANAPMQILAKSVAAAGVKHVHGDLVADATGFDAQKIPDGWLRRYLQAGYAARVSALSLNENLVWVAAYPGEGRGAANVVLEPSTSAIPLAATVRTVPGSTGGSVTVRRRGDGTVEARGWIGSRSAPRKYELVVEDPAPFAAGAFRNALAAEGVVVDGAIRLGATPPNAVKVASLPSPPLARMVAAMNRESINHYAELLFRDAARGTDRATLGSAQTGFALLKQFMTTRVGAQPDAIFCADGSGLSTLDRVTPRAMVQLLGYANSAPWGSAFHASLPVAGESELLRHRMKFTPAQGNLHAKTGTTNTVISLGGYVTAHDGELLAFSFIYNGADRWNAKSTIDVMGATMAGFARE